MKIRISLSLLAIIFSVNLIHAQTIAAVVESIKGSALVKKGENGKPKPLAKDDKLFEEDLVQCGKNCQELKISFCNVPTPIEKNKWITITASYCGSLDKQRGGRPKGEGIIIIFPADSEKIQPENFSLRWKPTNPSVKFDLVLRVYYGNELASVQGIDGSKGYFNSDYLKAKLKEAQKAKELVMMIELTEGGNKTDPDSAIKQKVKFRLISDEDQKKLHIRLKAFESEHDSIILHVKRGLAFAYYGLFSEAVQELENALKNSQNRDAVAINAVINLAIMANYHVYNDKRVKELCLLTKSEPLLSPCLDVTQ